MAALFKDLCDAIFESLENVSDDFQNQIRDVFCSMDEAYKATKIDDLKRAERLCTECRHIILVMLLFPIEFKLAMGNLYKKTLCGFLSIYLDFKMMLSGTEGDQIAFFDKVMEEIFLILGKEDATYVWGVVVTSHALNRLEVLKFLVKKCVTETRNRTYECEQYIRMVWVLHVFFTQCKRAGIKDDVEYVMKAALKIAPPPGLCKWMCHHFTGFGWKGLTDDQIHEALVSEKQPKKFFKQVYVAISKDDTLKYQPDTKAGNHDDDSSSQCSETSITKKRSVPTKQLEDVTSPKKTKPNGVKGDELVKDDNLEKDLTNDKPNVNSIADKEIDKDRPKKVNNNDDDDSTEDDPDDDEEGETTSSKSGSKSTKTKLSKTLGPRRPLKGSAFLDSDSDEERLKKDKSNEEGYEDANEDETTTVTKSKAETFQKRGRTRSKVNADDSATDVDSNDDKTDIEDDNTLTPTRRAAKGRISTPLKSPVTRRSRGGKETVIKKSNRTEDEKENGIDISKSYKNGAYCHIFEEFERQMKHKGEPVVLLDNCAAILPKREQESEALTDLLHERRTTKKPKATGKRKARFSKR